MSHHYSGVNLGFPQGDARLNFTDLFAFPKPGDASKSKLIMNARPSASLQPPGPATAIPFATDALYEVMIDTDGDAVADIAYSLGFQTPMGTSKSRRCAALRVRRQPAPERKAGSSFKVRRFQAGAKRK